MAIPQVVHELVLYRGDSRRIQMKFINEDDETGVQAQVPLIKTYPHGL